MTSTTGPTPREHDLVQAYLDLDPISICTRLVAALRDAAHGWRVAADELDGELAATMRETARRREEFAVELSNVVSGRSGQVTDGGTMSGHLLTWWLQIRALTARDTSRAVLKVCESGSRALLAEYRHALESSLPDPIHEIVVRQLDEIESTSRWLATELEAHT